MLVAGGHGRRTAPAALAHCRAPRLNRFVLNTKFVVRGTPQAHDAASPARRSKYRTPQGGDGAHVGRAAVAKLHVFRTRGLDAVGEAPRCGELCPEKTTERPRLSWVVNEMMEPLWEITSGIQMYSKWQLHLQRWIFHDFV